MVISRRNKYLFIEIPLTASWAIHRELIDHYDGTPVMHKHASYPEYLAEMTEDLRKDGYFIFATVRNPLDLTVSRYFKLASNHRNAFSAERSPTDEFAEPADLARYRDLLKHEYSFSEYFQRYQRRIFSSMIDLSAPFLDHVIYFESLQSGFSEVLTKLGVEQVSEIPVRNQTAKKTRAHWSTFYDNDIIPQAQRVFGPFMERWSYHFPEDWPPHSPNAVDRIRYRMISGARQVYYTNFRYSNRTYGKGVRRVRALLFR